MDARRGRPPYPGTVTPAEDRVLQLVRQGLTNGEIADRLGLTLNTVKYHVANLLAKAEVDSREQLRGWRTRGGRLRSALPALPMTRWLWIGAGSAGAAIAGVAVLAAALSVSRADGDRELPPAVAPAAATAVVPTPVLALGPDLAANRVQSVDTVAVVDSEGDDASVTIVDTKTGATVASGPTNYNPIVTFRRSRNELLLTHRVLIEGVGRNQTLDILDLSNNLALKRRISIPGRPEFTVGPGGTWQAISNDERYFAVYSWELRDELEECGRMPADGPSCTRSRVRVIDLDAPNAAQTLYELPRHCFGGLVPHGTSGFVATCGDGYYVLDDAQPSAASEGPEPRYLTDPVLARNLARGSYWLSVGDGWFGALMEEGSFVWSKDGQPQISNKATPPGMQLRWPIFTEIGGGLLVAGYIERYYDQQPAGLAVFNLTTGQVEKTMPSFNIGRSMVAGGPDEVLATTQDGRLIAITVSTGAERTIAQLSANAETAFLVR